MIVAIQRRIQTEDRGGVTVVTLMDRKILDVANIQELGEELFALVDNDNKSKIVLDFACVTFLSAAALNKFIVFDKKIKRKAGKLCLCGLILEIMDVFVQTRLNELFDIRNTVDEAIEELRR